MSNTNPNYGHSKILSNLIHAMNHSSSSHHSMSSSSSVENPNRQQPLLQGYLHKIHKRSGKRQKYFVIFDDAPEKPGTGRLEYFDNEKKFKSAMEKSKTGGITNEKRSIILCTCFNINRRCDTKYKHVIGLYRKDDTFSIIAKDEQECNVWLKQMLILQRGKESVDAADQPRPTFEHVWEVDIIRRGLGQSYKIFGTYRVCITDTTLSLVRIGPPCASDGTNRPDKVDFALAHMRRCGSTQSVFYLEVGRFTSTGAGEIWMETYDPMIAENMNTIILNTAQKKANSHRTEENMGPMIRIRSQSANETSRPVGRRATMAGAKPNFSPSELGDSTESSATSTGTIIMNQNALKPKNNQTHSVSQMSLQSTGIATSAACSLNKSHNTSNVVDKTSKCTVIQCSYPTLTQTSCHKEQQQQQPTTSSSQPSTSTSSISISTITNVNNVMSTSSSPSSSTICHQRALSLPQNSNVNNSNNKYDPNAQSSLLSMTTSCSNRASSNISNINTKSFAIQPVHHRTRSLPLTEESAIDFTSQSPPNFTNFSPIPTVITSSSSSSYTSSGIAFIDSSTTKQQQQQQNNNSMESIIEDYQNMDVVNNNSSSYRSNNNCGSSSILKQLSKIANSNLVSHNCNITNTLIAAASSPSQLRKKRQHHNVMTASLRSSSASTRERCDSFPLTRNRTTSDSTPTHSQIPTQNGNYANNNNNNSMPPPRRPVSMMYGSQRYGNSPPNNSSPISPPSCSESDASSASIDEPDGFIHSMTLEEHGNHLRDYNSFSIPEENELHWHKRNNNISLNHNQRKESPIPPHEAYVDMHPYSYSCSPGDSTNNAYMPMSPGIDYRTGMYTNTGAHSRASSLAEDTDGYVPMHPSTNSHDSFLQMSQNSEDYMNMQAGSNHHHQIHAGELSSATSSCSITSGTPSTDIRFSEYHLDKVQARFTPSEDDELLDRPPRTYSVGSKLEYTKRKLHIDRVAAEHSNSRHRAYSVGSRNIKVTRAELTSHSGSHTPSSSHNSPVAMNHHEINNNNNSSTSKNKKSSSAPLLANVLGKTDHGSFDPMDHLMEIDFTSDSSLARVSTPLKSSPVNIPSKPNDDYMNMSGRQSSSNKSVSSSSATAAAMSPYVDMRPVGSRRVSENNDNDYMDMNPASSQTTLRTSNTSTSLSSSPLKTTSAPRSVPLQTSTNNSHYMDMSPRSYDISSRNNRSNNRMTSSATSLSSQKVPSDDYLNMSPVNKSLLEVDLPKRSSVPDGYMEMSWNAKNKSKSAIRNNGNDNPSSSSDEYINMDYSNNNDGAGTSDSSSSAKDRSISLPIAIQKRYSSSRSQKTSLKSGSVETAPPAFLPLANTNQMIASVSPTRSTNITRTRCDSRDSGIMTPSGSQATIFPFSPGSPMKQFGPIDDSNLPRKCLVDGSTGTIKLSEEEDIIEEEPRTPVPMGMNNEQKQVETLSNDYAIMNLGEPVSKKPNLAATPVQLKSSTSSSSSSSAASSANATSHFLLSPDSGKHNYDYINCTPSAHINSSRIVTPMPITPKCNSSVGLQESGDYAIMNPVKTASSPIQQQQPSQQQQQQQQQQSNNDVPPQTSCRKSLLLTLSSQEKLNMSNSCFKPIVEDDSNHNNNNNNNYITNNNNQHPLLQRHVSEKGHRQSSSNDSGYEILARPSLSRPNSVNSEKIKCSTSGFLSNRPSSANSERLASTSSSTSTLCEIQSQSSSSSTLKNIIMMDTTTSMTSAVPSPMSITSRPESVSSDVHMSSRPPSVTERELHYASLDLPPCSNSNPIHLAQKMDVDENSKMELTSSPQTSSSSSSASSQQSQPAFTYAQIDFVKSESLKAQQHQQQQQQQNQSGSKK